MKNVIKGRWLDRKLWVTIDRKILDPARSQKLQNKSPDGFGVGYAGSAPSQLALAIILEFAKSDDEALRVYQDFKWEFLTNEEYQDNDFEIEVDIQEWIKAKLTVNS